MIDAEDVVIAWENDDRGRVDIVVVAEVSKLISLSDLENVRGAAVDGDWLKSPSATPEAIFLHMAEVGFRNQGQLIDALTGFKNIAECRWARELHEAAVRLSGC